VHTQVVKIAHMRYAEQSLRATSTFDLKIFIKNLNSPLLVGNALDNVSRSHIMQTEQIFYRKPKKFGVIYMAVLKDPSF